MKIVLELNNMFLETQNDGLNLVVSLDPQIGAGISIDFGKPTLTITIPFLTFEFYWMSNKEREVLDDVFKSIDTEGKE